MLFLSQFVDLVLILSPVLLSLVSVAVFGATAIGLGFSTHSLGGVFNQVSITMMAATVGPTAGLFLLSAIFPKANAIVRKPLFPNTSNPIFVVLNLICCYCYWRIGNQSGVQIYRISSIMTFPNSSFYLTVSLHINTDKGRFQSKFYHIKIF